MACYAMACRSNIEEALLTNPHIWRYGSGRGSRPDSLSSGFAALDDWLEGGWPGAAITELLLTAQGIGELRLLLPALQPLQQQLCWINPPYIPYAPALADYGLDLSRLLLVRPESAVDALWAMDQALRSQACVAVLGWFSQLNRQALRRLQVVAESAGCPGFVFRPARFARHDSAAPLRIRLSATAGGLQLDILRNRYGRVGSLRLSC